MRKQPVYVMDIIGDVVSAVSTALVDDGTLAYAVHYFHDHPLGLIETLQKLTRTAAGQAEKYPFIALMQPFDERHSGKDDEEMEVTLEVIIATLTTPKLSTDERYVGNYKPILYPIYNEFIEQLYRNGNFSLAGNDYVEHTKTDQPYWGHEGLFGNEGNLFQDFIDAIEIKNLKLKIKPINCASYG